ncbi:hypothetical protein [Actinoplanes sp. NPDC049118]|uniref:hypothetical protein n=1 Tax=Actinoplanes sp. NPDC049118 TaxID=3155769 RepID=UPI0033D57957
MPRVPLKGRFGGRIATPDLYRLVAAGLVMIALCSGIAGAATAWHRSALTSDITDVSGPLSVGAQELYRSLSDADATATNAFLANGVEPAGLRTRYLDDIARATAALTVALRSAGDEDAARLTVLADQLPVYTGLVETARSYNRLGVPLGGAYVREASGLMRLTLLPAAQDLLESAQRRLLDAQRGAAGLPWAVLLAGLVTLASLLAAQVLVARRTNRVFNVGLVVASLIAVASPAWSITATGVASRQLEAGRRDGSALVALLADARRASLQARADEALTLIARGSGAGFEKDFRAALAELIGPDGTGGLLGRASSQAPTEADRAVIEAARAEARRWSDLHGQVRRLDDGGDYQQAVRMATDTGPQSPSAVFGRLDTALEAALAGTNDRVDRHAGHAGGALGGLGWGLVLITLGLVGAVIAGIRPRIGEYR